MPLANVVALEGPEASCDPPEIPLDRRVRLKGIDTNSTGSTFSCEIEITFSSQGTITGSFSYSGILRCYSFHLNQSIVDQEAPIVKGEWKKIEGGNASALDFELTYLFDGFEYNFKGCFEIDKDAIRGEWASPARGSYGTYEWRVCSKGLSTKLKGVSARHENKDGEKGEEESDSASASDWIEWTEAIPFEMYKQPHCLLYHVTTGHTQVLSPPQHYQTATNLFLKVLRIEKNEKVVVVHETRWVPGWGQIVAMKYLASPLVSLFSKNKF